MAQDVERAIAKLKSFHDGDSGVVETIGCGDRAVPALREMIFERKPSGLYQARCRAVAALAALGAHDVLIDFLRSERPIADPVEQLGEDAVINATALVLAERRVRRDRRVFELLVRLARRPCLTGVIFALGTFRQAKAIPLLVEALSEGPLASACVAGARTRTLGLRRAGAPVGHCDRGNSALRDVRRDCRFPVCARHARRGSNCCRYCRRRDGLL